LYYPADADLIAIRLKKGRGFTAEVRRCLGSYGKKGAEVPKFPVPEDIEKYVRAVDRPIIVNLNLLEGRDDDAIAFMKTIKASARCDIVKTLLRAGYDKFPYSVFIGSSPIEVHIKELTVHIPSKRKSEDKNIVKIPENEKHTILESHQAADVPPFPHEQSEKTDTVPAIPDQKIKEVDSIPDSSAFDGDDGDDAFAMFANLMG
jgi:hypothetical protein